MEKVRVFDLVYTRSRSTRLIRNRAYPGVKSDSIIKEMIQEIAGDFSET